MNEAAAEANFPSLDEDSQSKPANKKSFINQLFTNDSLTRCSGFINEVRSHIQGEKTLHFVRVGLFQGSVQEADGYKGKITNCELLAGATLNKWLAYFVGVEKPLHGIRLEMEIRNLTFEPKLHEGKAYLDSRGIIETIKFGYLVK